MARPIAWPPSKPNNADVSPSLEDRLLSMVAGAMDDATMHGLWELSERLAACTWEQALAAVASASPAE